MTERLDKLTSYIFQSTYHMRLSREQSVVGHSKMADFNEDEYTAPDWMDHNFFEMVVKSVDGEKTKLTSIDMKPATQIGEHYGSVMYRVKLNIVTGGGVPKQVAIIVKTKPFVEGVKKDLLAETSIFKSERMMYTKMLPEMQKLLNRIGDNTVFSPLLLYASDVPDEVLIFEDLSARKYEVSKNQLDFNEANAIFCKLGKFHACSYYLATQNFDFSEYNKHIINEAVTFVDFLKVNLDALGKSLEDWNEFAKHKTRFYNFKNNLQEIGYAALSPNDNKNGRYNVLNHGDFHYKNLMFIGIGTDDVDVLFLDYQLPNFASPGQDLGYACFNCCSTETRENHRDELIYNYYVEFNTILEKLKTENRPSMVDLQCEISRMGFIEVLSGFALCTFLFMDPRELKSMDEFMDLKSDKLRIRLYSREDVQRFIKKVFLDFIRKGYF